MSDPKPTTDPFDEVERYRMPLLDHLRELRRRLLISAGSLGLGMLVSLAFVDQMYAWLTRPFAEALVDAGVSGGLSIVNSPFEGIYTWLLVAFGGAVVFSLPVIAYQLWLFIAPGLYQTERRLVVPLAMASTALFLGGGLFAYYVIFPFAFPFFLGVVDAQANLSLQGYLSAVVRMMVAFGACFQLPIVTIFAARLGLIDHRDMIWGFRYAVVAIFIVAAIITPPEVLTQILLALPLVVLYIFSIGLARLFTTKVR